MSKPTWISINLRHLLETDELDEDIVLPYSDELNAALKLIGNTVKAQKARREAEILDMFLSDKYRELRKDIENVSICRGILREIAAYKEKK